MSTPDQPSPGREILRRLHLAEQERREQADRDHRAAFAQIARRDHEEWAERERLEGEAA